MPVDDWLACFGEKRSARVPKKSLTGDSTYTSRQTNTPLSLACQHCIWSAILSWWSEHKTSNSIPNTSVSSLGPGTSTKYFWLFPDKDVSLKVSLSYVLPMLRNTKENCKYEGEATVLAKEPPLATSTSCFTSQLCIHFILCSCSGGQKDCESTIQQLHMEFFTV